MKISKKIITYLYHQSLLLFSFFFCLLHLKRTMQKKKKKIYTFCVFVMIFAILLLWLLLILSRNLNCVLVHILPTFNLHWSKQILSKNFDFTSCLSESLKRNKKSYRWWFLYNFSFFKSLLLCTSLSCRFSSTQKKKFFFCSFKKKI